MVKSEKFCAKQKQSKSRKNKNKHIIPVRSAFGYGLRFVALFLVVLIASPMVFKTGRTQAYFIDLAEPITVTSTAGTLLFITTGNDFSPSVTPTANSTRTIDFQNTGSLDFIYQVRTADIATSTLCNALELKDDISGIFKPLTSFLSATGTVSVLPSVALEARLATSSQSLSGQTCRFDLILTAWQTNFADASLGFSYTQTISSTIVAGEWQETPPTPHTVVAGDIVINELMWMGSATDSGDEWLELRNMTGNAIDIGGWQLTKKNTSGVEVLMLTIPAGQTIAPNGLFLISDYDQANSAINVTPDLVVGSGSTNDANFALANNNLQIKLYKGDSQDSANLMDTADDGSSAPLKGSSTSFYSMERDDIPSVGTLADSWHNCEDTSSTVLYWDAGRTERGTPGAPNLSDEDSSPIEDPALMGLMAEVPADENLVDLLGAGDLPAEEESFPVGDETIVETEDGGSQTELINENEENLEGDQNNPDLPTLPEETSLVDTGKPNEPIVEIVIPADDLAGGDSPQ